MNRLYIRAHESQAESTDKEGQTPFALEDQFEWLLLSTTADVLSSGKGKSSKQLHAFLQEQGFVYGDPIFIPPEHRVQVRRVELAKGQHRHAQQVVPFLLEESLGQPLDELHYTLLNKADKDALWVSIVAKQVMVSWLNDLQGMGWQQLVILPVNNLLPFWPEQDADADFIFTSAEYLLYKDQDSISCLPLVNRSYLPKREKYNLCCDPDEVVGFESLASSFELLTPWSNQSSNHKDKLESWLYVIAAKVQNNNQFLLSNLCHGEFGRQTQIMSQLKPWFWIALLALFSFSTELYLTAKETHELNVKADIIYLKTSEAFLRLAPDEGRISYLDRQIKGRIQRAKQGSANTQKSLSVYEVMALIDQVRAKVKGSHRITKLDYSNKEYRLDWQADQRDILDAIQTELERQPLQVIVEQVAKRGDTFMASIKLKGEAK